MGVLAGPAGSAVLYVLVATAITLALYVAAAALQLYALTRGSDGPTHARWFAAVGVALHGTTLLATLAAEGRPGYADFLSALAFVLMLVVLATAHGRLATLGGILAPLASVLLGLTFAAPSAHVVTLDQVEGSWFLPVHIGLVLAATAALFVEFAVGLVQVLARRRLKLKRLGALGQLPALDVLDRIQFRALVFGLAALALGIAAGGMWASTVMHHESWVADPKVWFTAIVWVWYAVLLQVRVTLGWHGRWSMVLSTIGFFALLFSSVGLDFVVSGFHAYGG